MCIQNATEEIEIQKRSCSNYSKDETRQVVLLEI